MNNNSLPFLFLQIVYHAPMLLVYLVAFVLALVFMGRATVPSILTLLGLAVLLSTTIAMTVIPAYLIQSRGANVATMMSFVRIVGGCAHALGQSLLVAAIFVGRSNVIDTRAEPDECVVI